MDYSTFSDFFFKCTGRTAHQQQEQPRVTILCTDPSALRDDPLVCVCVCVSSRVHASFHRSNPDELPWACFAFLSRDGNSVRKKGSRSLIIIIFVC
mmetsp:Transcript_6359/g.15041  ORF Transcript_6359/g.15041 Transcript_6359/m.15041 type:complete len:96 (-) Transcript_6359:824-1111(-)